MQPFAAAQSPLSGRASSRVLAPCSHLEHLVEGRQGLLVAPLQHACHVDQYRRAGALVVQRAVPP